MPNYVPKEVSQFTQLASRAMVIFLPSKPYSGQKITQSCSLPVSDDEIFHGVSLIFSRRGIAVPQQQVKPGGVPSLQDGTHIEHGFNSQDSYGPFIRRCIVLVLKQGHPDSELSIPIHTDVQRTEKRKTIRVESLGSHQWEQSKSSPALVWGCESEVTSLIPKGTSQSPI